MSTVAATAPEFFRADLERLNQALHAAGAVRPPEADGFIGLEPGVLPDVQRIYANLCSYGWANGWLLP